MISKKVRSNRIYGWPQKNVNDCVIGPQSGNQKDGHNFSKKNNKKIALLIFSMVQNLLLITATIFLICKMQVKENCCNSTSYYDGSKCASKGYFNESCEFDDWCQNDLGLKCSSQRCVCSLGTWNSVICEKKKENEICSLSDQCIGNLVCLNGVCKCSNSTVLYFDNSTSFCEAKKLNNFSCLNTLNCRDDLGLNCTLSLCQCDVTNKFWDGNSCTPYRLYGESCLSQNQCIKNHAILCEGGVCSCNSTLMYYDAGTDKCQLKKNESELCTISSECLGDMTCINGLCKCFNTTTHFFNQSSKICSLKTFLRTPCASSISCREDLGLICNTSNCVCDPSIPFWSSVRLNCIVCPSGWTVKSGYCFHLNTNLSTWPAAHDWCSSYNASLLNLVTTADYDFFKSEFFAAEFWIGLRLVGSKWHWTSDSSTFYDPSDPLTRSSWWNINEPSVGDIYGRLNNGFEVWGRPNISTHNFLCQVV